MRIDIRWFEHIKHNNNGLSFCRVYCKFDVQFENLQLCSLKHTLKSLNCKTSSTLHYVPDAKHKVRASRKVHPVHSSTEIYRSRALYVYSDLVHIHSAQSKRHPPFCFFGNARASRASFVRAFMMTSTKTNVSFTPTAVFALIKNSQTPKTRVCDFMKTKNY